MPLHQYDYIFAIGMIFAFLDAWNIGANDVANSFATSVSSRSLTMKQAMMIASVMEFSGAIAVGSRVSDTIRSKILDVALFEKQPTVLMLGMMCALIGSATWLTIATSIGLPVSTTHCIVGAVIGMGIATVGVDGVTWGWNGKGVAQICASWVIAPGIAGALAAIVFLITKYTVLKRQNPLRWGLIMVPVYFAFTSGILTMVIVWKGAPSLDIDHWTGGQLAGCIIGVGVCVAALVAVFFVPYLYRKLAKEDWTLRWYHIALGPLLLKRGPVPEPPAEVQIVQDYYKGHATREDLEAANIKASTIADMEHLKAAHDIQAAVKEGKIGATDLTAEIAHSSSSATANLAETEKADVGPWYLPKNLPKALWAAFMHGVNKDIIAEQSRESALTGNIADMHARAAHFDNKTEHLYSFLQVLTAATASFAHGSNDVSNAIGPLATIFLIWNTGETSSKSPVPVWILAYGGAAIVIGLWTYGYNIMRNLGNRLTLHSPTRGFSMELGAATTVVMATQLALPISTTQCIVGATMGVALCNGDFKALNWRIVGWCYMGWIITLPIAGTIAGCLMGIILNAPRW
ncbi:phosphate-repressible phosphate permease [Ascobolus immersus RN42]|uniref:Phosphate transporter n=1 Tax=Ascobolus immersus RN42 TaxID=1160509 RepID=A0A3N4ID20_ASCIM|nr:phosphate-repressible phosphate permease [Ascobolus immersus RN42]